MVSSRVRLMSAKPSAANRMARIGWPVAAAILILGVCAEAKSDDVPDAARKRATDWQLPKWLPSMDTLKGSLRVTDVAPTSKVLCRYAYSTGDSGVAICEAKADDPTLYMIRIPHIEKPALGEVVLRFEIENKNGGIFPFSGALQYENIRSLVLDALEN